MNTPNMSKTYDRVEWGYLQAVLRKMGIDERIVSLLMVARGAPMVSHIFFADDSYIFCKANEREATNVLTLLNVFEQASGQKINFDKSSIFFSPNTDVHTHDAICGDLGIHEADDHRTYLGLPNIIGRDKL
uniref:Reverse transcriptase n=1 Tax=Cannabis sativa TaxID=3483 RepID=A0A803PUY2_CANSA